ncbi:LysR substrate-binding domain-containing protein [Oceanicella actignis]|uniref:LysR family transcriptional regulator, hydrogen peroxide-inducible genes activator n=1 Tax=Oceanicella actignis TaxID=1189325 RepID=A0A1M7U055_9RHOB|nr:LysR substrate-binding domain-containing protein [Oceanicella actignis]TYO85020.1 LysR family hydrogen peroxide-inducible transcriptional activator [Oceanicella actignis]SET84102.1 transcriptional regulator, LysR family [Oceanicella actignis]SHN76391.1 LysR family transcriptional regulator, hydrogen peroxide-inducible genes activator [Oceanicella actignis]
MNITLRQLRYFLAVAEHRHFGRAAEACAVSQPALSIQIRELETALGATLIERARGEAILTPAGREAAERAARVLAEARELEAMTRRGGGLRGRLSLGVIPTVAPYLLPAALPLMRARDIALELGVREAQTARLMDELRAGRLDAVIAAAPLGDASLEEAELFEDRFLLAGSPARLAALRGRGGPLRPDGLDAEQLLLLDEGHCLADQTLAACALARPRMADLRAASLATLARLAAEGFGMTLLPEIAAAPEAAAAPGLELARFDPPEPGRRVVLARRAAARAPGGGRDWFDELAELLREAAAAAPRPPLGAQPSAGGSMKRTLPM